MEKTILLYKLIQPLLRTNLNIDLEITKLGFVELRSETLPKQRTPF